MLRFLIAHFYLIVTLSAVSQSDTTIYSMKDSMVTHFPEFPGGDQAMSSFLLKHFNYSSIDPDKFQYGTLWITFVVEADGTVSKKGLVNRSGESLLLQNSVPFPDMPHWKPARNDRNESVRFKMIVPMIIDP